MRLLCPWHSPGHGEYWSGLSFPPPGDLPDPGMEPTSPTSAGGFFTTSITWEAKKADAKREMSMVPPAGHFCPVPGCAAWASACPFSSVFNAILVVFIWLDFLVRVLLGPEPCPYLKLNGYWTSWVTLTSPLSHGCFLYCLPWVIGLDFAFLFLLRGQQRGLHSYHRVLPSSVVCPTWKLVSTH